MSNSVNDSIKVIDSQLVGIEKRLSENLSKIIEISKASRELSDLFTKINKPSSVSDTLKTSKKNTEQLNALLKEQNRLEKNLISTQAKKELATESVNKSVIKGRLELQQQNKAIKEAAVLSSRLSTEMQKQSIIRNQLAKTIQDLNLKKNLGIKLSDKEQKELAQSTSEFKKYDKAIRSAKESVGRFQENVGNYPKAMSGAISSAKSLAANLGLVGGAFLIGNVIRDTFNRVREFDKTMQSLSGVLRTNRSELKDLESTIISVAGSSVKTSNEVAKLASTLSTLGKTKQEIKTLLPTIVDLGIGLDAAADDAGEFLIQMLNSFGEPVESAKEYAETIASIRTSTTLDFQKMRDSFQYITPISKILNKDLAYTGALVGVLSDNGIKAESAGRLLATSIQKLAARGLTLNDALNQVNEAQERGVEGQDLLKMSTELFGVQAAKIGLTLASNKERINELTESIRGNQGALDDLVGQQLESLDAKLKILDSTWEEFILSIENGKGVFGNLFKGFVEGATLALKYLNDLNSAAEKVGEATGEGSSFFDLFIYGKDYEKALEAQKKFNEQNKNIDANGIETLKSAYHSLNKELQINTDLGEDQKAVYSLQLKTIREAIAAKEEEQRALVKEALGLGFATSNMGKYIEARKLSIYQLKEWINLNKKNEEVTKEEEKLNNAITKRNAVLAINTKGLQDNNKELQNAKELLESLKELYSTSDDLELPELDTASIENFAREMNDIVTQSMVDQMNFDLLTESFDDLSYTIEQQTGINSDILINFFDKIRQKGINSFEDIGEIASSSFAVMGEVSGAFYDSKIEKYEQDIEASNLYYDTLLENETLSDEEAKRLEADKAQREEILRKKQAKEKRKQAEADKAFSIARIITETSVAVVEALPNIPLSIAVGALGAIQLATVLATPIPKFAEGGEMKEDGLMMINDHNSGRLELVERKGDLYMSTKKNAIVKGEQGDIIHKDAKGYFDNLSDSEISKDVNYYSMIASLQNNVRLANVHENKKIINSNNANTDRLIKVIKAQKTRFNVQNNLSLGGDIQFLSRLNDV